MRITKMLAVCSCLGMLLIGCGAEKTETVAETTENQETAESQEITENQETAENKETTEKQETIEEPEAEEKQDTAGQQEAKEETAKNLRFSGLLNFVDVYGQEYEVEINPDVEQHSYDLSLFLHDQDRLSYEGDENYTYRLGLDVSYYQGAIDWEKVKQDGFDFVFIRIGYRGYSEGVMRLDTAFEDNIAGAQAAGLDVGVYFFAQAINEEEAKEEAEFVIDNLKGYELQLPVVYDPETIQNDTARTDDVTGEQFTKNAQMFCKTIADAGYEPAIYSNMLWEAYNLDLAQLADYPIWYADYEALPQTPYHFEYWQYTNAGEVDGIGKNIDLDIQLIPCEPALP